MSSNPNTDSNTAEQSETMDVQTAQRVEQEKLTRRAALRKLGFGAGMAAFALLGVDDLARMVGKRMERMAGDNKVAEQVAKEFQAVGVASANPSPYYSPQPCCSHCTNQQDIDDKKCLAIQQACTYAPSLCYANAMYCISTAGLNATICDGHCNASC